MDNQILKVKCPCCAAVLAVKNQPGLENMSLTCPNCKTKSRFTAFESFVAKNAPKPQDSKAPAEEEDSEGETQLGPSLPSSDSEVTLRDGNAVTGKLALLPEGELFDLEIGLNVVGRKANSSTADVQIPTPSRLVSRRHFLIEVKRIPGKGLVYYMSNSENKNDTYVGTTKLEPGDCVILKNGDQIKMADVKLKFIDEA